MSETQPNRTDKKRSLSRRDLLLTSASAVGGALAVGGCATGASTSAESRRDPEKKSFDIGLNTSTLRGHKLPITKTIEIAAKAGYTGIEPWPNEINDYVDGGGSLKDLDKMLKDKGLKVTGAIAFFPWIVDDDAQRKKGLEEAKVFLDQLSQINATHIAAPPSGPGDAVEKVELLAAAERYRDSTLR